MKFARKNEDLVGSVGIAIGKKSIKISGREIFETDDKKIIEVLKKDVELVAVRGSGKKGGSTDDEPTDPK